LTGSINNFTDILLVVRELQPRGHQKFDRPCCELGVEERLTKPVKPKTNGVVERFNPFVSDVIKTNRHKSAIDLRPIFCTPSHCSATNPSFEPSNKNLSQKSKTTYYNELNLLDMRPIGRRERGLF